MKKLSLVALSVFLMLIIASFPQANRGQAEEEAASGRIVGGYRVVSIPGNSRDIRLTVYRGGYVRFVHEGKGPSQVLSIPELSITETLSREPATAPYVKMQKSGTFAFYLGDSGGTLAVVEYLRPNYEAVSAIQAAELIRNIGPFVLDVRTPQEYREGHLEGSTLIPVQDLQRRLAELSKFKNENILIYCATGNRSTVASKILIDSGFKRIFNLRHGIHEWRSRKLPVVTS